MLGLSDLTKGFYNGGILL